MLDITSLVYDKQVRQVLAKARMKPVKASEPQSCHRCCGSGRYGPAAVWNGVCMRCSGTGVDPKQHIALYVEGDAEALALKVEKELAAAKAEEVSAKAKAERAPYISYLATDPDVAVINEALAPRFPDLAPVQWLKNLREHVYDGASGERLSGTMDIGPVWVAKAAQAIRENEAVLMYARRSRDEGFPLKVFITCLETGRCSEKQAAILVRAS